MKILNTLENYQTLYNLFFEFCKESFPRQKVWHEKLLRDFLTLPQHRVFWCNSSVKKSCISDWGLGQLFYRFLIFLLSSRKLPGVRRAEVLKTCLSAIISVCQLPGELKSYLKLREVWRRVLKLLEEVKNKSAGCLTASECLFSLAVFFYCLTCCVFTCFFSVSGYLLFLNSSWRFFII